MLKKLSQKEIYKDAWLSFYQDETLLPDGTHGTYAWANRRDGVGIVVVTTDNKILLNKEYRYVLDDYFWEIPGGGIDPGEDPKQAAIRELFEETGIRADGLENLGEFYPLNSFITEKIIYFYTIIEPTRATTAQSETSEDIIEQKYVTFEDALSMIDRGEIRDALTANVIQMIIRKIKSTSKK